MLVVSLREGNSKLKQKDQLHKYLRYVFPIPGKQSQPGLLHFFKTIFARGIPINLHLPLLLGGGGSNPRETTYRVFLFFGGV